jgi:hypothetical protein
LAPLPPKDPDTLFLEAGMNLAYNHHIETIEQFSASMAIVET